MIQLAAECPDCINNVDLSHPNSILTCVITIGIAAVIRWIERRNMRKNK
jgi:hypothetical protein